MQFIRFVVPERDSRTGQPMGLMSLAYAALRAGEIEAAREDELRESLTWLESNLPVPNRFARKHNVSHKETHGISWVKSEANEVVRRLRRIAEVLIDHGHPVEMKITARPGYVVYEDDWQVVAEPFNGEPA